MTKLYGISNCDTVKKARAWLGENDVEFGFHDFRKDGLDEVQLEAWVKEVGWEVLLNRRGTTWRKLPDDVKENINEASAIALMMENPAIIKRPVLDLGDRRVVGFKVEEYSQLF